MADEQDRLPTIFFQDFNEFWTSFSVSGEQSKSGFLSGIAYILQKYEMTLPAQVSDFDEFYYFNKNVTAEDIADFVSDKPSGGDYPRDNLGSVPIGQDHPQSPLFNLPLPPPLPSLTDEPSGGDYPRDNLGSGPIGQDHPQSPLFNLPLPLEEHDPNPQPSPASALTLTLPDLNPQPSPPNPQPSPPRNVTPASALTLPDGLTTPQFLPELPLDRDVGAFNVPEPEKPPPHFDAIKALMRHEHRVQLNVAIRDLVPNMMVKMAYADYPFTTAFLEVWGDLVVAKQRSGELKPGESLSPPTKSQIKLHLSPEVTTRIEEEKLVARRIALDTAAKLYAVYRAVYFRRCEEGNDLTDIIRSGDLQAAAGAGAATGANFLEAKAEVTNSYMHAAWMAARTRKLRKLLENMVQKCFKYKMKKKRESEKELKKIEREIKLAGKKRPRRDDHDRGSGGNIA